MKNLLWFLIAGSRGGVSRGKIINLLRKKPSNMNQIAKKLKLDYKTVLHHMKILEKNNIVTSEGDYGAVYFISEQIKDHLGDFDEIWERIG